MSETRVDLSNDMTWRQMIGVGVSEESSLREESLDKLEGPTNQSLREGVEDVECRAL